MKLSNAHENKDYSYEWHRTRKHTLRVLSIGKSGFSSQNPDLRISNQTQISRQILLFERHIRLGFQLTESVAKSLFGFCVRLEVWGSGLWDLNSDLQTESTSTLFRWMTESVDKALGTCWASVDHPLSSRWGWVWWLSHLAPDGSMSTGHSLSFVFWTSFLVFEL